MGRLIDADEIVRKYGDWYTESGGEGGGYIGTIGGLIAREPTAPTWRSADQPPKDGEKVLVKYRVYSEATKCYYFTVVVGWHARRYSILADKYDWWDDYGEHTEYNPADDEIYITEGWYEQSTTGNRDPQAWFINAMVVAWQPLPEI